MAQIAARACQWLQRGDEDGVDRLVVEHFAQVLTAFGGGTLLLDDQLAATSAVRSLSGSQT